MRVAVVASLALVGCGYPELPRLTSSDASTDASSADAAPDGTPDATPDAARTCYVGTPIAAATLGSAADPTRATFIAAAPDGPNMGMIEFILSAQIDASGPPYDLFYLEVLEGSGFNVNQPYAFSTNTNPNAAFTARVLLFGDLDPNNGSSKQYFHATNGSITFNQISAASNAPINGTMTATHFVEVNEATGAVIQGGCVVDFGGMTFYLQQQNPP